MCSCWAQTMRCIISGSTAPAVSSSLRTIESDGRNLLELAEVVSRASGDWMFVTGTDSALIPQWFDGGWRPSITDSSTWAVLSRASRGRQLASGRLDVFVTGTILSAVSTSWFDRRMAAVSSLI